MRKYCSSISLLVQRSEATTRLNEGNKKWKVAQRARLCGVYLINIEGLKAWLCADSRNFCSSTGFIPTSRRKMELDRKAARELI
jgi:hypothetical protein